MEKVIMTAYTDTGIFRKLTSGDGRKDFDTDIMNESDEFDELEEDF